MVLKLHDQCMTYVILLTPITIEESILTISKTVPKRVGPIPKYSLISPYESLAVPG